MATLPQAFICDAVRTPFGRYGGALSSVRTDDLGAIPIRALMERNPGVDWAFVSDVLYGCANQAGEDNRNVAHMSSLLAGLPVQLPGATINRLCGSGLDAIGTAARAIKAEEATLMIAGGVESMSRAPFVMPKAETAFSRARWPAWMAATALSWLRRAMRSWASRSILKSSATFSAVSGMESTPYFSFISLLMKRQPIVVSYTALLRLKAASILGMTKGARLMLSTPPAIIRPASPALMARAAEPTASRPLPPDLIPPEN